MDAPKSINVVAAGSVNVVDVLDSNLVKDGAPVSDVVVDVLKYTLVKDGANVVMDNEGVAPGSTVITEYQSNLVFSYSGCCRNRCILG